MKAEYIINAIVVLRQIDELLQGRMTSEQMGRFSAQAYIAATNLQTHSGLGDFVVTIEKVAP